MNKIYNHISNDTKITLDPDQSIKASVLTADWLQVMWPCRSPVVGCSAPGSWWPHWCRWWGWWRGPDNDWCRTSGSSAERDRTRSNTAAAAPLNTNTAFIIIKGVVHFQNKHLHSHPRCSYLSFFSRKEIMFFEGKHFRISLHIMDFYGAPEFERPKYSLNAASKSSKRSQPRKKGLI